MISPDVLASLARMAAAMRARSCSERSITSAPTPRRRRTIRHRPRSRRRRTARRRSRRRRKPPPPELRPLINMPRMNQRNPGDTIIRPITTTMPTMANQLLCAGAARPVEPQRRALLPFRGVGRQHGDDIVDAARDAAGVVAGLEARRDRIGDDHLGERVGQRALQPVSDFYPHPPFVGRDEQQHAVVLGFLAELPGAKQLVGVRLDLLAVERGDGGDDKLDAGLGLEIGQLGLDRPARVRPG